MCDKMQSVSEALANIASEYVNMSTEGELDVYEPAKATLLNMPVEIILKICNFLDANFLKYTFSKVCRRFSTILDDDHIWKYRIHSKVKSRFPALPELKLWNNAEIDWQEICVEMDTEEKKWVNVKDTMRHIIVKDVHFASVDTVLLVNNGEICISGGRDRSMALWNVLDIKPHDQSENTTTFTDTKPKHIRHDAHIGWIWDLAPDKIENASKVYSASWDNTVKAWDLDTEMTCVQTFQCGMSALSIASCDNIVITGLYSKVILTFDIRVGPEPINSYKQHRGPVLALNTTDNMVASVSEDKTLAVWDRVAGKPIVSNVKLPTNKAFPVCINWRPNALYIGDSKGSLHLLNPEDYTYGKTHEIWPEPPQTKPCHKITSCYQSQGNMIVCSDRGEIKFLYNSSPPQEYASLKTSTFDVTQMRYQNGIMVTGTCDSAIEFWIPNNKYSIN